MNGLEFFSFLFPSHIPSNNESTALGSIDGNRAGASRY